MIRFDTRDKKPKIYNIAILSAVFVVIMSFLFLNEPFQHVYLISGTVIVYLTAVIVMLLTALIRQIRYNPYSYNTIFYTGFILFTAALLLTQILITVQLASYPPKDLMFNVIGAFLNSAKNYMLLSGPFVILLSLALCISNVSLIRHEGFRLVNVLGIILSFLMMGGELFLFRFDYYVSGSIREVVIHELLSNLFAAVYLYFECMIIGVIISYIIVCNYEPDYDKDFMIILGCGIRKDGTPTPILQGRIDRALTFYHKQKETAGRELVFIPSGGQGPDEVISEAESMKRYLLSKGIKEEQIVKEDRSTSTYENMKFSKEIIDKINPEGKVVYSTTNFHVFRSGLYARRVKMRAVGIGARTKWYFWPNATVREFVGLVSAHRLKQAVILGIMILVYILLVFVNYLTY
ncbi:MAG: YdcF family protein [Erysipelotrichaceae bacterium]|nr:YdcF family protein [Erysipelotrichaceae bacterium]